MKNQAYRMTMLYDFYGDLLTDRQREFYDLYYNEDLSLAEIAENYGITRQGVRDIIVRAENTLMEVEEKTGLILRYRKMQDAIADVQETLNEINALNETKFQDDKLEQLCIRLRDAVAAMGKE